MSRKVSHQILNLIYKFNNEIIHEFPNIGITYSSVANQHNVKPPLFYRLEKKRPVEIPRVGCDPLKRLDKDLTEPTKQVLVLDQLGDSNGLVTLDFIKKIRKAQLNIDINAALLDIPESAQEQEDMENRILSIINQLPKVPILISLSHESSDQLLKLFKKYSNPLFPFAILKFNTTKRVGEVKNLTDIYVVNQPKNNTNNNSDNNNTNNNSDNNKNNSDNNNNNNNITEINSDHNKYKYNNLKSTIITNNANKTIFDILKKQIE